MDVVLAQEQREVKRVVNIERTKRLLDQLPKWSVLRLMKGMGSGSC
jgi:hypothetical protein